MDRERGFAGMGRREMKQADIDAAGAPGLERGVERLPGAAEDGAREHAVAKDRAAKSLRLLDQRADNMTVIDDVGGPAGVAAATRKRQHFGGAQKTDQPPIVDMDLEPRADQPRRHGIEDVAYGDRRRPSDGDGRQAKVGGAESG